MIINLLTLLPLVALFKIHDPKKYVCVFQFICISAGIVLLLQVYTRKIQLKLISACFAMCCVIQSAWIIGNWIDFDFLNLVGLKSRDVASGLPGALGGRGFSGGLIVLTLPFLLAQRRKFIVILPIVAVILIHTRGTSTPLGLGIFCTSSYLLSLITKKIIRNFMQRALFVITTIGIIYNVDAVRINGWSAAINIPQWWRGPGIGWLNINFMKYHMVGERYFANLHNEYLNAIFAFGPIAFLLFYLAFMAIWKPRSEDQFGFWLSASCIMIHSIAWFPFHLSSHAVVAIFSFGILLKPQSDYPLS